MKANLPPVSIIVPTLNEEKYLPILLESISKLDHPLEVIIVDAKSDDQTVAVVESYRKKLATKGKPLTIVDFSERSIAKQRNTGAKKAQHNILLFCDADIVAPSTESFSEIITNFNKQKYAIASTKIITLENIRSAKVLIWFLLKLQKIFGYFGKAYFSGAFILVRQDIFRAYKGFDETLRISEDVEFSTRVSKQETFKLYNIPIQTSMRRVEKYGYSALIGNPKATLELIFKGKQTEEKNKIYYPFGEF